MMDDELQQFVSQLCNAWSWPELAEDVHITYSHRLISSLGVADTRNLLIRLNTCLQQESATLLQSVICHELAHLVAFNRFGKEAKPHGPEWRSLIIAAGFRPTTTYGCSPRSPTKTKRVFNHVCPVCQNSRTARRTMHNWRCDPCTALGLAGTLLIEEVAR